MLLYLGEVNEPFIGAAGCAKQFKLFNVALVFTDAVAICPVCQLLQGAGAFCGGFPVFDYAGGVLFFHCSVPFSGCPARGGRGVGLSWFLYLPRYLNTYNVFASEAETV